MNRKTFYICNNNYHEVSRRVLLFDMLGLMDGVVWTGFVDWKVPSEPSITPNRLPVLPETLIYLLLFLLSTRTDLSLSVLCSAFHGSDLPGGLKPMWTGSGLLGAKFSHFAKRVNIHTSISVVPTVNLRCITGMALLNAILGTLCTRPINFLPPRTTAYNTRPFGFSCVVSIRNWPHEPG